MDTAVVECRYRDKVIGHLVVGPDGWLKYVKNGTELDLCGQLVEWYGPLL